MNLFLLKYGKWYISTFDNIKPSNLYEMYVTIYYSIITKFIYPMTLLQLDRKLKGLRNLVIYFVIFDLPSSSLIYKNIDASHTCKNPSTFRLHKMNYFSLNVRLFLLLVGKVVVSMKINVYLHPPDYFKYDDEKIWLDILLTKMQGSIKIELRLDNI